MEMHQDAVRPNERVILVDEPRQASWLSDGEKAFLERARAQDHGVKAHSLQALLQVLRKEAL